jgi:Tfp pilus assembly protein PilF
MFSIAALRSIFVVVIGICIGCGESEQALHRMNSADSMRFGLESYASKNYADAHKHLTDALTIGGLHADAYAEVLVKRAVASAHLKQFDAALEDLDRASQGAPQMDVIHAARAFVFQCQGNREAATTEFAVAKRINPSIQAIE